MAVTETPTSPKEYSWSPAPPPPARAPLAANVAILISVLAHVLGLIILGMAAMMKPHRESVVPVFELVNLEKPKLRPLQPKTLPPPEPPPPEPEPVRPPEAPKLTPKPEKAVVTKKPEPKVVKEVEDRTEPVKEVVREQQVLQQVQMNVPSDPRLSFWAARVKKKVDNLWNPPAGIDILGVAKVVVAFKVSRDGTLLDAAIAEAAGNSTLDELALMTIKRLEGIPPIPDNFPNDELEVKCEFLYQGN